MSQFKTNCILMSAIFLWASAFIGIKVGLSSYTPGALALFRFIVASVCMGVLYYRQHHGVRIPWRSRVELMIIGVAGIGLYNVCLNYGELSVSAGIASFIIGLMPVITVLLSWVFLNEQVNYGTWLGILVSLLGLSLLACAEYGQPGMMQGMVFILISSVVGSIQTIAKKRFLKKYNPIHVISWVIWGGALFLTIYLPDLIRDYPNASYQSNMVVLYMGIFPAALAYSAWTYVLKKIPAGMASTSLYSLPFLSTLLGFIVLGEEPSLLSLLGGGLALFGAVMAHRAQTQAVMEKTVVA